VLGMLVFATADQCWCHWLDCRTYWYPPFIDDFPS
jgi:hypothetical protein